MIEFVIVCISELVELALAIMNLATIIERSDSDDCYLARFLSYRIYSSYHSLIDF